MSRRRLATNLSSDRDQRITTKLEKQATLEEANRILQILERAVIDVLHENGIETEKPSSSLEEMDVTDNRQGQPVHQH